MKVALDATPLTAETGGVPRYVRELRRGLEGLGSGDSFVYVTDQRVDGAIGPGGGWLERRWWLAGLPMTLRRERVDVFHGTEFAVPYVRVCATVLSMHDLSPWMDAAWHGAGVERVRRRTPWLLRMGLATMVLTLSEAVRRRAIARFGLDPSRVVAVPLAGAWVMTMDVRSMVPSASVSFAETLTLPPAPSFTVSASFTATGASLTGVTVMVTVAVLETAPELSLIV